MKVFGVNNLGKQVTINDDISILIPKNFIYNDNPDSEELIFFLAKPIEKPLNYKEGSFIISDDTTYDGIFEFRKYGTITTKDGTIDEIDVYDYVKNASDKTGEISFNLNINGNNKEIGTSNFNRTYGVIKDTSHLKIGYYNQAVLFGKTFYQLTIFTTHTVYMCQIKFSNENNKENEKLIKEIFSTVEVLNIGKEINNENYGSVSGNNGKIDAIKVSQLFSKDIVFNNDDEIIFDGKHHIMKGLQFNSAVIDDYPEIKNNMINISKGLGRVVIEVEQNENLIINNYHKNFNIITKNNPITGITFFIFCSYHMLLINEISKNKYQVMIDKNLIYGIPHAYDFVTEFIKSLRKYNELEEDFSITFLATTNLDSPLAIIDSPVLGANKFESKKEIMIKNDKIVKENIKKIDENILDYLNEESLEILKKFNKLKELIKNTKFNSNIEETINKLTDLSISNKMNYTYQEINCNCTFNVIISLDKLKYKFLGMTHKLEYLLTLEFSSRTDINDYIIDKINELEQNQIVKELIEEIENIEQRNNTKLYLEGYTSKKIKQELEYTKKQEENYKKEVKKITEKKEKLILDFKNKLKDYVKTYEIKNTEYIDSKSSIIKNNISDLKEKVTKQKEELETLGFFKYSRKKELTYEIEKNENETKIYEELLDDIIKYKPDLDETLKNKSENILNSYKKIVELKEVMPEPPKGVKEVSAQIEDEDDILARKICEELVKIGKYVTITDLQSQSSFLEGYSYLKISMILKGLVDKEIVTKIIDKKKAYFHINDRNVDIKNYESLNKKLEGENKIIGEKICDILEELDKYVTITELQNYKELLSEYSNQKISMILKMLVEENRVIRTVDNKKAYFRISNINPAKKSYDELNKELHLELEAEMNKIYNEIEEKIRKSKQQIQEL